jgi:hypothetical protein
MLTFVIVGGSPTGVELAAAIAELGRHGLAREFRAIDPSMARVILMQAGLSGALAWWVWGVVHILFLSGCAIEW